jgi:hypothetical protein
MLEVPEMEEEDDSEEESPEMETENSNYSNPAPIGDAEKNEVNWPISKSEDYESDNEEEDKWDNLQKACWSGYKQEGMKEKNGRMVPNCVPVNKSMDSEDLDKAKEKYEDVIKPRKGEPADKELYSRIVSEAKKKFDTYPSAYANGWVVQEYKRRGGTYKIQKSIWSGTFLK